MARGKADRTTFRGPSKPCRFTIAGVTAAGVCRDGLPTGKQVVRGKSGLLGMPVGVRLERNRMEPHGHRRCCHRSGSRWSSVRAWVNLPELKLQKFGIGVVVRTGETTTTLAHPIRHPQHAVATLRSKHTPLSDLAALARWLGPTMLRPATATHSERDQALRVSFDNVGLTGRLRRDVLDTFLAGVLADSTGDTSANYARQLMRFFALGSPGLPRAGMQALPEQLAGSLLEPVRTGVAARELREVTDGVEVLTDKGVIRGRAIVCAKGRKSRRGDNVA